MTTPPTAEQWATAMNACGHHIKWREGQLSLGQRERVRRVAQALADQAAAIHARYEKAREEVDESAREWAKQVHVQGGIDLDYARGRRDQAQSDLLWIREVSR